jgi:hypothetical protein
LNSHRLLHINIISHRRRSGSSPESSIDIIIAVVAVDKVPKSIAVAKGGTTSCFVVILPVDENRTVITVVELYPQVQSVMSPRA